MYDLHNATRQSLIAPWILFFLLRFCRFCQLKWQCLFDATSWCFSSRQGPVGPLDSKKMFDSLAASGKDGKSLNENLYKGKIDWNLFELCCDNLMWTICTKWRYWKDTSRESRVAIDDAATKRRFQCPVFLVGLVCWNNSNVFNSVHLHSNWNFEKMAIQHTNTIGDINFASQITSYAFRYVGELSMICMYVQIYLHEFWSILGKWYI